MLSAEVIDVFDDEDSGLDTAAPSRRGARDGLTAL